MRKSLLAVLGTVAIVSLAPLAASPALAATGSTSSTTSTSSGSTTTNGTPTTAPSTTAPSPAPPARAHSRRRHAAVGIASVAGVELPSTARIFGPPGHVRLRFSVNVRCTRADVGLGVGAVVVVTETLPAPAAPVTQKAFELNPVKPHYFCPGGKHNSVRIRFALATPPLLPTMGTGVASGRSATITATARILPRYREAGAHRVKAKSANCTANSTSCRSSATASGSITIAQGTGRPKKR